MPEHVRPRDIKRIIAKIGGEVVSIECTKHFHVYFTYHGHECRALFPLSPSDTNWEQLKYSDIKRDLRGRGIWRD